VNITSAILLVWYCSIKPKIFTNRLKCLKCHYKLFWKLNKKNKKRLKCQSTIYVLIAKGNSQAYHWTWVSKASRISFSVSNFLHCLQCWKEYGLHYLLMAVGRTLALTPSSHWKIRQFPHHTQPQQTIIHLYSSPLNLKTNYIHAM